MNKFTLDNAGNYGEVRSVNGIKPDENGNVNVGSGDAYVLELEQLSYYFTNPELCDVLIEAYNNPAKSYPVVIMYNIDNKRYKTSIATYIPMFAENSRYVDSKAVRFWFNEYSGHFTMYVVAPTQEEANDIENYDMA